MYAQTVPELASLLDHMERKDPMLVISTTDASMESVLPFQLPSKYGCVVLGFFNVESVEVGNKFLEYSPVSETLFGGSARTEIVPQPQASNLARSHGGCNYVTHPHRMPRMLMEIWLLHGGCLLRSHRCRPMRLSLFSRPRCRNQRTVVLRPKRVG